MIRYERIFTLVQLTHKNYAWTRIEQEFLSREAGDSSDRVVRIRTAGPNSGLTEIESWEHTGVRVKRIRTLPGNIEIPTCQRYRSSRDSRISTWNGYDYSVDRYHGSKLPELVTFSFDDLRSALDFHPPEWVNDEITVLYRKLSRRFAL